MQNQGFLQDLAIVLLAAGGVAVLFHRLQQPKVLGYILAGLILGPHTPPVSFIRNEESIRLLADLGIIFLMFSLGLEFNLRRLRKVGATAGLTAFMDVTLMVWLGYMLGKQMGWSTVESLFLGGMVCDSSTTILAKILQDMGRTRDPFAGLVIGITVVEDVLTVSMIAILTGVAVTGAFQTGAVAVRLLELLLFLTAVVVVGLLSLPRLLDYLHHRFENDELLLLTLLGVCFGVTLIGSRLDLSFALGAVLVGAIASETHAIHRLGPLVEPLRYIFSAVFFVAVGMMLDPAILLQSWVPLLAVTGVIVLGKLTTNTLGSLLTGHDVPTSIRAGAAMAQTGEFAFIIAALGVSLGAIGQPVYQIGVTAAVITTALSPYLLRGADRLAQVIESNPACRRCTNYFLLYGQWVERISQRKQSSVIRRAVRRSLLIILINTALIAAAIASAGFLARRPLALSPYLAERPGLLAPALWLVAMLFCLPMYVASLRKIEALGMILAEVALPLTMKAQWAQNMRRFVSSAILVAGSVGLFLLTFALSSAMLPSRNVLLLLMGVTVAIAALRWPRLVRIYAQAQTSLGSMLKAEKVEAEPAPPAPEEKTARLDLKIESTEIAKDSAVAGRSLRSLRLRSRTGASVVGIERAGRAIAHPGPDEKIQSGDRVVLVGDDDQLLSAGELLSAAKGPDSATALAPVAPKKK